MRSLSFLRCGLSAGAAFALLSGCGELQSPVNPAPLGPHSGTTSKVTFNYTGGEQTFQVPTGVTEITIAASGASGDVGSDYNSKMYSAPGGLGGRVRSTIAVNPGETLAIFVGGSGADGGFNGGGRGGEYFGMGGGASDVRRGRDRLADRVVVGGGGGGGGDAGACISTTCGYGEGGVGGNGGGEGGKSGGKAHGPAPGKGGGGATQSAGGQAGLGGASGCEGFNGGQSVGGAGGGGGSSCGDSGGGGGGGRYGGGGGGSGGVSGGSPSKFDGAGGGGGSSFAEKSATNVYMHTGTRTGDGVVILSW